MPHKPQHAATFALVALAGLSLAACGGSAPSGAGSADATAESAAAATAASSPMQAPMPIDGNGSGAPSSGQPEPANVGSSMGGTQPLTSTEAMSDTSIMGPLELQGASFTLDGSDYTLVNGRAEDPKKMIAMGLGPWSANGDLNADGTADAIGVLVMSGGGSGNFSYLLPAVNKADKIEVANPYFLGDRVQIKNLAVAGGQIQLDVVTHGPSDPMCCPSQNAKWTFMVVGNQVVVTSPDGPPTPVHP